MLQMTNISGKSICSLIILHAIITAWHYQYSCVLVWDGGNPSYQISDWLPARDSPDRR